MAARRMGHLVIVGGGEDREGEKKILCRFVELAGGKKARIVVLTTASQVAADDPKAAHEIAEEYEQAFKGAGAAAVDVLNVTDRTQAGEPAHCELVGRATGIYMSGGAQSRLTSILGGTPLLEAMHEAHRARGACLGGTSAGASALSQIMVLGGADHERPKKGDVDLAPGLGFIGDVLIDQHFFERQRLGRLISVIAVNPAVVGIGVDEDTALVVTPNEAIEVIGSGAVTVLDGQKIIYSNFNEVRRGDTLALTDLCLHMLPAGFAFHLGKTEDHTGGKVSDLFKKLIARVVAAC